MIVQNLYGVELFYNSLGVGGEGEVGSGKRDELNVSDLEAVAGK